MCRTTSRTLARFLPRAQSRAWLLRAGLPKAANCRRNPEADADLRVGDGHHEDASDFGSFAVVTGVGIRTVHGSNSTLTAPYNITSE